MRESDIIAPLGLMSIMGMLAGDKKSNLLQAQIDAYQKEQEKTVEDPVEENQDLETVSDEQKKIEYDKAVKEHEENFKENQNISMNCARNVLNVVVIHISMRPPDSPNGNLNYQV